MTYFIKQKYRLLTERKSYIEAQMRLLLETHMEGEKENTFIKQIRGRSIYEEELAQIKFHLHQLEESAASISQDLVRELMMIRLCAGMDALEPAEKKQCTSFADSMNAIEGRGTYKLPEHHGLGMQ